MSLTIKQAANELDISESTVKKYLKDFDLELEGSGIKAVLQDEVFNALKEITKLRANGLSIQEIKELKKQEPTKSILEEIDETAKINEQTDTAKSNLLDETPAEKTVEESSNGSIEADEISSEGTSDIEKEESQEQEELQEQDKDIPRRRGFHPRYVERQISQDSKRVISLRQRLKNPNISISDKLFFEEALERRIVILNGWRHILRWIAK